MLRGRSARIRAPRRRRTIALATSVLAFGNNDTLVWTRQGEEQQQNNFGSADKTTVFVPNAGHFVMFERSAPRFRAAISGWLHSRFR